MAGLFSSPDLPEPEPTAPPPAPPPPPAPDLTEAEDRRRTREELAATRRRGRLQALTVLAGGTPRARPRPSQVGAPTVLGSTTGV